MPLAHSPHPALTFTPCAIPQVMFLPRFLNRIAFGLLAKKSAQARSDVLALLRAKGLDSVFVAMNNSLPAEYRRATVCELADDVMTGINFAGVNGTTHLLVSVLAHLVGGVSDVPSDSLHFPPTESLIDLFKKNPDAFIIESCRVDPPVTSACATFPNAGDTVTLRVGCGETTTEVKQGTPLQYVFGGLAGPNRDPAVFDAPNTFNPMRKDLQRMLSWNGALEAPADFPRFCPGQQLSMIILRAILGSIDELKDADFSGV